MNAMRFAQHAPTTSMDQLRRFRIRGSGLTQLHAIVFINASNFQMPSGIACVVPHSSVIDGVMDDAT